MILNVHFVLLGVIHHHGKQDCGDIAAAYSGFKFEDVCKPGSTLLWDLLQEHTAVSIQSHFTIKCKLHTILCY